MNRSMDSSISSTTSLTTSTLKPILKKSASFQLKSERYDDSITEEIDEEIDTRRSNYYDETFETDRTETYFRFKAPRNLNKEESSTISTSSTSDSETSATQTQEARERLIHLKKTNYIQYVRVKMRMEQEKSQNKVSTHRKQIERLIDRIEHGPSTSRYYQEINDPVKTGIVVDSSLVNRLKSLNLVERVKREQDNHIELEFGEDLINEGGKLKSPEEIEQRNRDLYLRLKSSQIRSKRVDVKLQDHEINYCDSLMLIAELARTLPRPSDPAELIWSNLMNPNFK